MRLELIPLGDPISKPVDCRRIMRPAFLKFTAFDAVVLVLLLVLMVVVVVGGGWWLVLVLLWLALVCRATSPGRTQAGPCGPPASQAPDDLHVQVAWLSETRGRLRVRSRPLMGAAPRMPPQGCHSPVTA